MSKSYKFSRQTKEGEDSGTITVVIDDDRLSQNIDESRWYYPYFFRYLGEVLWAKKRLT